MLVKAMSTTDTDPQTSVDPKIWNYHPAVPIPQGGVFRLIWDPFFVLKGIALSSSAERKCNLPMAVISYPASRTR